MQSLRRFDLLKVHCMTSVIMSSSTSSDVNIAGMRKPYKGKQEAFKEDDLAGREPFSQFKAWFDEACKVDGILEANAMSIATATKEGKPSVRMVLLKGMENKGFQFYTNYGSRKAKELESNPQAALLFYWSFNGENSWSRQIENPYACIMFYWEPLMKQIRVEGSVRKLSEEESTKYFHSRPKSSQIGACVSRQSTVIASRDVLTKREEELTQKYADQESLPKPDYWGGFHFTPEYFEFWQGQTTRIHDRIVFRRLAEGEKIDPELTRKGEDGWYYERLSP